MHKIPSELPLTLTMQDTAVHDTTAQINQLRQLAQQAEASNILKLGIYQHYKGAFYQVLDVAQHSETSQYLVVYRALYGEFGLWVRPVDMFTEQVVAIAPMLGLVPRFAWYCES